MKKKYITPESSSVNFVWEGFLCGSLRFEEGEAETGDFQAPESSKNWGGSIWKDENMFNE